MSDHNSRSSSPPSPQRGKRRPPDDATRQIDASTLQAIRQSAQNIPALRPEWMDEAARDAAAQADAPTPNAPVAAIQDNAVTRDQPIVDASLWEEDPNGKTSSIDRGALNRILDALNDTSDVFDRDQLEAMLLTDSPESLPSGYDGGATCTIDRGTLQSLLGDALQKNPQHANALRSTLSDVLPSIDVDLDALSGDGEVLFGGSVDMVINPSAPSSEPASPAPDAGAPDATALKTPAEPSSPQQALPATAAAPNNQPLMVAGGVVALASAVVAIAALPVAIAIVLAIVGAVLLAAPLWRR